MSGPVAERVCCRGDKFYGLTEGAVFLQPSACVRATCFVVLCTMQAPSHMCAGPMLVRQQRHQGACRAGHQPRQILVLAVTTGLQPDRAALGSTNIIGQHLPSPCTWPSVMQTMTRSGMNMLGKVLHTPTPGSRWICQSQVCAMSFQSHDRGEQQPNACHVHVVVAPVGCGVEVDVWQNPARCGHAMCATLTKLRVARV